MSLVNANGAPLRPPAAKPKLSASWAITHVVGDLWRLTIIDAEGRPRKMTGPWRGAGGVCDVLAKHCGDWCDLFVRESKGVR